MSSVNDINIPEYSLFFEIDDKIHRILEQDFFEISDFVNLLEIYHNTFPSSIAQPRYVEFVTIIYFEDIEKYPKLKNYIKNFPMKLNLRDIDDVMMFCNKYYDDIKNFF